MPQPWALTALWLGRVSRIPELTAGDVTSRAVVWPEVLGRQHPRGGRTTPSTAGSCASAVG